MKFLAIILLLISVAHGVPVDSHIVNSLPVADMTNFGSQLSLRVSGSHHCGATLIGAAKALTAAHCVDGLPAAVMTIMAGSINRDSVLHVVEVDYYLMNPSYLNNSNLAYPNDIAIIHLKTALPILNENINIIPMAETGANFTGRMCNISGWGRTCKTCPYPPLLNAGHNLTALANWECEQRWGTRIDAKYHICVYDAINLLNKSGTCDGDSGGPAVCDGVLAGIASFGDGSCEYSSLVSVYANVAYYRNWIDAN